MYKSLFTSSHFMLATMSGVVMKGCLHSLDWTTGLSYFSFLCTFEQILLLLGLLVVNA